MHLEPFLWVGLPLLVAAGSALLSFSIMRARMEAAVSKEREASAAAQAQAMDSFLRDIRVEERSYVRESQSMFSTRKVMVVQERLYLRHIPLSNWVERELLLEEGADPQQAARASPVFETKALASDRRAQATKLIQESLAICQKRA